MKRRLKCGLPSLGLNPLGSSSTTRALHVMQEALYNSSPCVSPLFKNALSTRLCLGDSLLRVSQPVGEYGCLYLGSVHNHGLRASTMSDILACFDRVINEYVSNQMQRILFLTGDFNIVPCIDGRLEPLDPNLLIQAKTTETQYPPTQWRVFSTA